MADDLKLFAIYAGQNPVTDELCAGFARCAGFFAEFVSEFAEHLDRVCLGQDAALCESFNQPVDNDESEKASVGIPGASGMTISPPQL